MCRYKFGDGKCSHPHNMAQGCVGEDNCRFKENSKSEISSDPFIGERGKSEDRAESLESHECPNTKTGIYCKKYGFFHCAGKENCDEKKDYMEHLESHQEKFENIDIEKEIG
ncbi:MAG: hypothetical protein ACOCTN_03070 [Candidatus Natronoplasma sp.]